MVEKKIGSGFTGPRPKNMVKWTLVLIYGRFYITDYFQGKMIFESQTRMLFNEVPEKRFTYSSFSGSVKKKWVTSGFGLKVMLGGSIFADIL